MHEKLLMDSGLTKNEARVYLTLLKIGKSQSGRIVKEAEISGGKVYETLNKLIDKGNTVVVIEHNIDVIKTADYIIDLGPEGGDDGGEIVAEGTPEQICKVQKSYTGKFIKDELNTLP